MQRFIRAAMFIVAIAFAHAAKPTVILVSFDGFRANYFDRSKSPQLHRLATTGVRARALIPSFPSKTFPNHYTIVTGLYPSHHGIVANSMFDPDWKAWYSMSKPSGKEARWYGGEPIWQTAEEQGQIAGSFFWVGSDVPINGRRPTYWKEYDHSFPQTARVDSVLAWLDLPEATRPTFVSLYFELVDDAGHKFGPDGTETLAAVEQMDTLVGRLMDGLQKRNLLENVNLILVSDHGMSQLSRRRVIYLEDIIDSTDARVVDWSPNLALIPALGREDSVYTKLKRASSHWQVYRKQEIPLRFHYRDNARIAPILAIADDGWSIVRNHRPPKDNEFSLGNHGYDPELPSMHALFIAHGSAFKRGIVVDRVENVNLYGLMCKILGLKPAKNDGDLEQVKEMLR